MILSLLASISWLSEYRINCVRKDLSYRQLRSNTLTSPESVFPNAISILSVTATSTIPDITMPSGTMIS